MQNNIENSEMDRASVLARAILSERHFFLAIHEGIRAIHIDDAIILAKAIERQRQQIDAANGFLNLSDEALSPSDKLIMLRAAFSEDDSK